ncbi:hypothetical protein QNN00_22380 [Bacillus velezensis]|nr:hypothetical protein [Bacillus velezensis]
MQEKHSPAPWRAVHSGEEKPFTFIPLTAKRIKRSSLYSNGRLIAAVFNLSSYSQQINAALMAKAPELLRRPKRLSACSGRKF